MKRRELLKHIRRAGDIKHGLMFSDKRKGYQRVKYWAASTAAVPAIQSWLKTYGHDNVTVEAHVNVRGLGSIVVCIPHNLYN